VQLTSERVVSTLDDLNLLDLGYEGIWPGEPDPSEWNTHEVDWTEIDRGPGRWG